MVRSNPCGEGCCQEIVENQSHFFSVIIEFSRKAQAVLSPTCCASIADVLQSVGGTVGLCV